MATKAQPRAGHRAPVLLLIGVIVLALSALSYFVYRSTAGAAPGPSGPIRQMKASARGTRRASGGTAP